MIREYIQKRKEQLNLSNKALATYVDVDPATISNFLNGKTEIRFETMLKIAECLFPDNTSEIIFKYCKEVKKKKEILRYALEYSSINSQKALFEYLLETQTVSENADNREWATVYKLVFDRQYSNISPEDVVEKSRNFKVLTDEMRIMCHFLEVFGYYEAKEYKLMFLISKNLEQKITSIKNTFIKEMYTARLSLIFANAFLRYKNDTITSRYYCKKLIHNDNVPIKFRAISYQILGMTYFFEDYNQSMIELNRALKMFKLSNSADGIISTKGSMDFVNNLWGKYLDNKVSSLSEEVHQNIKKGDYTGAKSKIPKLSKDSPFTKFYTSLITEDNDNAKDLLYESLEMFIKKGDRFYAENLVAVELARRNARKSAVRAACTI